MKTPFDHFLDTCATEALIVHVQKIRVADFVFSFFKSFISFFFL